MKNIWTRKNPDKPLLVLAPMAGYTDSAFRMLCKKFGADIVMTELISADSIYHNKKLHIRHPDPPMAREGSRDSSVVVQNDDHSQLLATDKTLSLAKFQEAERPIVIQLFGKYPEKFAFAAKWIADNLKPDGIDINMGCPARKVVGSDHGAALLKNPELAVEIVRAVRGQINIPLSVKTRLGWESDDEILEFAPKLIEAGADALIIHGRTYKDGFKNKARWGNIYRVKSDLLETKNYPSRLGSRPEADQLKTIIGNGDIQSYGEAIERSESNGIKLDGVAIGRASFGKPWVFANHLEADSLKLKAVIIEHAKLCYDSKGEHGIIEFRKHLLAYLRGFPNAKELRLKAVTIETLADVENIIKLLSV